VEKKRGKKLLRTSLSLRPVAQNVKADTHRINKGKRKESAAAIGALSAFHHVLGEGGGGEEFRAMITGNGSARV